MVSDELNKEIQLCKDFTLLSKKVSQAIRIYNELYERRAQCYEALAGKKPNAFRRLLGKTATYERGDPLEGLRIINARERRVVGILEEAHKRMAPALRDLDSVWKNQQAHLFVLETYLNKVIAKQKEFLLQEHDLLEKPSSVDMTVFRASAKDYFDLLDETATLITREFGNFYSPKQFIALMEEKQKENGALRHLLKQFDEFGGIAIFVAEFTSVNVLLANPSMDFFEKYPPMYVIGQWALICYLLILFKVPVTSWGLVKKHTNSIVSNVAVVTFIKK
jgi:hypothetical protein